ncbi:MAG: proprotein convertase P-domain-containing protein [Ferruginibacter sp.]|nr:proprotein convertase P-domain-containing protein [Ferruginibacter sp.]
MRKLLLLSFSLSLLFTSLNTFSQQRKSNKDMRVEFELERTKDLSTGKVPWLKLWDAIEGTKQAKSSATNLTTALSWIERGPDGDFTVGGNPRPTGQQTSGRIRASMIDSLDPTHNTVWVGGVDGGLWKTTNINNNPANWTLVNDYLENLAIAAICQDPRPGFQNIMYFCTGESFSNADAVRGVGVFKSIDAGATWTLLTSTTSYRDGTRILCDYLGNVYLGTRNTGLLRSTDGGTTWTTITPSGIGSNVCDLEISSTSGPGRLHVVTGIFSQSGYRFTDNPETATSASGWTAATTAFTTFNQRTELGISGNVLYACPDNASHQVPTIWKSTDGGANWAATPTQPSSTWASGQGWYSLSCAINPANSNEVIVGGLDLWKSTNSGSTWTHLTSWATSTTGFYVHADQHNIQWWDGGTKLMFNCDGGVHFSTNGGTTNNDRNKGLRIKQFYSVAIHPTKPNYFIGGTQDNGMHRLDHPGLDSSAEVVGGDGCYSAIDQSNGDYQFGSYVYNVYRRSTNGGLNWTTPVNIQSTGRFVNPWDYDNTNFKIYACNNGGTFLRWNNPRTGSSTEVVSVSSFSGQNVSAVYVSPYTANRVYFGTGNGRIVQVDNADVGTSIAGTLINGGSGMPAGYVNCIVAGSDDQHLIACFTNYGVQNVWVTTNGGTTWTAIDGNLPDMPVRWALFHPDTDTKAYIATETGVWETDLINGASTVWNANSTFPTVRTDMIKYRSGDRTIAAGTHGRGIWTAIIPTTTANPEVTINQAAAQPDPTSASPINFTVVFDQVVTGFATGDVTLSGTAGATTAVVTGSGTTYNVAVSGMTSSGTVIATIAAGVCTNAGGDPNNASTSTDNTVTYNLPPNPPNVTINQAAAQPDPTSATPINYTVVFDQVVTGFATGDVTLSGTAGATTATVTGSGTTYNVAVSGMTSSGTVIASIAAGVCTNAGGDPNNASTSTDNTVTFNLVAGSCTSVDSIANDTVCNNANAGPYNFTSPVAGTTFSWVNNNTAIGLAASGTGNIPAFTATNATNAPITGTVTVTPSISTIVVTGALDAADATLSSRIFRDGIASTCAAPKAYPGGFGTGPYYYETHTYVNNSATPVCVTVSISSTTSNQAHVVVYNGSFDPSNQAANYIADNGSSTTGPAVSFSFTAPANATIVFVVEEPQPSQVCPSFTMTIDGLVCTGPSRSFDITVNPSGQVDAVPNQTLCKGTATDPVNFTSTVPGTVFSWVNDNTNIGLAAAGIGNIPSFIAQNNTSVPQVANITVTPTFGTGGVQMTQTFNYTGAVQTWVVPAGVTSINIKAWGAQGNSNAVSVVGGLGGYADGTLAVTPGSTLYINVGGGGTQSITGGFNGGGDAGTSPCSTAQGGGGGGASDVRVGANTLASRTIVAAGGGGAGGNRSAGCGRGTGGGGGGGYYGGGGAAAWPFASTVLPTGGTQTAGGIGGTSTYGSAPGNNGSPGVLGIGGKGGNEISSTQTANATALAGGVGGGLIGADGAYSANWTGQSGAGGSSYIGGVIAGTTTQGINNGNGKIEISYSAGGTNCPGTAITFTITVNPNASLIISAIPGATLCEGDPALLTVYDAGGSTPPGTLYQQTGTASNGSPSQVFEPANAAYSSQSADDFTVPANTSWNITRVTADGIGSGAPTSINVFVYENSGSNLPGSVVASYPNLTTFTQTGGNYVINLPSTLTLSTGTYWLSVQVNMSFATGGQWFWGNTGTTNIGSEYAWQNPGGGFGTPCTGWGYGATGCNVGGGVNRNNLFSVYGSAVTTGAVSTGTFLWSPAAGLSSTTGNPVAASPMVTTTYKVVRTTAAGCKDSANITLTINQRPKVTANPVSTVNCAGTTATFTVTGTGTALTYQWQVSTAGVGGPWVNVTNTAPYSGATTATLTVNPVTVAMSGYAYRCVLSGTCPPGIPPLNVSGAAVLTVNPLPVVTVTPTSGCGGVKGINGLELTASGADTYTWSPITGLYLDAQATVPYTGGDAATVYAAPSALTVYTVTGTLNGTGCFSSATALVNYTPPAPTVTPASVTMCLGDNAVMLTSSSSSTSKVSFNSGTISVAIPEGSFPNPPAGAGASTIAVSGIPSGATISRVDVKLNITHAYVGDVIGVLKAPNGQVFNLDALLSATNNPGANFVNTVISSAGTTPLSSGSGPFTGTFKADAVGATFIAFGFTLQGGPNGYVPTTQSWNDLYSTPNGDWTVAFYDAGAPDQGTLTNWSIDITYVEGVPSTATTWTPIAGLYNDANATSPYAGNPQDTVYTKPTPSGVYNYYATVQNLITADATPTTPMAGGNGNYLVAFNVRNNNAIPVTFSSISSNTWGSGTVTANVYYSTTAIAGNPGPISTANGWNQFGTASNVTVTANTLNPLISGLTLVIPPGATYGIALDMTGATYPAYTNGSGIVTYSNGGCDIITGGNVGWGGPNAPATPVNNPRNFNGSITFSGTAAGTCTSPARKVVVTVNDPTTVTTQPENQTICTDKVATFTVKAAGTGPFSYQWQESTDNGNTFNDINDGGVYSGTNSATLTITAPPVTMSGYLYRVIITGAAPCKEATSFVVSLTVNPLPVVVIAANPTRLLPGLTTTITSTVTPNAVAAGGYVWTRNGATVGGSTPTLPVDVDGLGDYQLTVTDINGCTSSSNIVSILDSVSGKCYIYPNPTSGQFQVRYYSVANNVLPRTLTVYDAKGDRVLTQVYNIGRPYDRMDVDMRKYGKGLYWVEIGDRNGNRLTMCRVVIQ